MTTQPAGELAQAASSHQALTDSQHARILGAYLGRLSLSDLNSLAAAMERCWREQANGNGSSQRAARDTFDALVSRGIGNLISYDKELIETVVRKVVAP